MESKYLIFLIVLVLGILGYRKKYYKRGKEHPENETGGANPKKIKDPHDTQGSHRYQWYHWVGALVITYLILFALYKWAIPSFGDHTSKVVGEKWTQTFGPQNPAPVNTKPKPKTIVSNFEVISDTVLLSSDEPHPILLEPGDNFDWRIIAKRDSIFIGRSETDGYWKQYSPRDTINADGDTAKFFKFKACVGVPATLIYTITRESVKKYY